MAYEMHVFAPSAFTQDRALRMATLHADTFRASNVMHVHTGEVCKWMKRPGYSFVGGLIRGTTILALGSSFSAEEQFHFGW